MKNCIIASTSTLYGGTYLDYLIPELKLHFQNCNSILFIPYAQPGGLSYEEYTERVSKAFAKLNIEVKGIHEFVNPIAAIEAAEGIFTGGGNTFLLVFQLYKNKVMDVLAEAIKKGTPYLGSSAGSNICGLTMQTTNDMPIIYPPSFQTLGIVPFNINPHYLDADLQLKHNGETREMRIKEFHFLNSPPVIGLREGSWLEVKGNKITLKGGLQARLFQKNKAPVEIEPESDLSDLK
jgi:dipeptidase E